jgi:hypothetical protein
MTIEQRLEQLEQRNKRLTVALTMMAVVICAVVTMAATGEKNGDFDMVRTKALWVANDAGDLIVGLSANDGGDGLVITYSAKGEDLVSLSSSPNGGGIQVYNKIGEEIAMMVANEYGNGVVATHSAKGKELVVLNSTVGR